MQHVYRRTRRDLEGSCLGDLGLQECAEQFLGRWLSRTGISDALLGRYEDILHTSGETSSLNLAHSGRCILEWVPAATSLALSFQFSMRIAHRETWLSSQALRIRVTGLSSSRGVFRRGETVEQPQW